MASESVLVLGGTGLLGAPTVKQLVADGFRVRVLARDQHAAHRALGNDVEIVEGDITDPESLERAMAGQGVVHISVGGPVDQLSAEQVVTARATTGLERITYLSGSTVDEGNAAFPMVAQKLAAEGAIRASGIPFTIFRPTWPMEQIPRFIQGETALVIGDRLPALHWFAAGDLARMVSSSLRSDGAVNQTLFVHGPEAWTMVEAVEMYRAAKHPGIPAVSVLPIAVARSQSEATGNAMLGFMADMMAYFDEAGELGDPAEANSLLGAPTTTLSQWIDQLPDASDSMSTSAGRS